MVIITEAAGVVWSHNAVDSVVGLKDTCGVFPVGLEVKFSGSAKSFYLKITQVSQS